MPSTAKRVGRECACVRGRESERESLYLNAEIESARARMELEMALRGYQRICTLHRLLQPPAAEAGRREACPSSQCRPRRARTMRRRGETREHTYRMILLDPRPRYTVPARETFVAREMRRHARGKVVVSRETKRSRASDRATEEIVGNDELKSYHARAAVFYFRPATPRRFFLRSSTSLSIYRSCPNPFPLPASRSVALFRFLSFHLFLFTFLAAPLPYKLISRLPRTDGAEQLNSLFPFTYPFVSTFTFIFE